jgi:hypothetical protein
MNNVILASGKNPLKTKDDLRRSLLDLLAPLKNYAVPGGYCLGAAQAHHSPKVALMEAYSRTLWGIAPLIAGGGKLPDIDVTLSILKQGVNPADPGWWGTPEDKDQRLVEMAAIALALLIARETFWDTPGGETRQRLYEWLAAIQERELPPTNWHFFRILVCAVFRELGLPVNKKAERESFDLIESLYRGDGWYQDGAEGTYDSYNPMAFHYYGLVYGKIAGPRDSERVEHYFERARLFGPRFTAWFREDGAVIPYGRSLTYRFAAASFFSACAFADLEVVPWGVMKGIVLRHLRGWFARPMLDNGGILSVGCAYPNLIMADRYNAPGSPYWGLKIYLVLALGEDHPFWRAEELPLPEQAPVTPEKIPGFIISHTGEDVQLLCPGAMPDFEMNHAAQKYGKFAYSARYGFCVSHGGQNLADAGGDSALLLSDANAGDTYWRERRGVSEIRSGENWTSSVWRPWPDVRIITTLVSLGAWHLRIHRIESGRTLRAVEGGFAVRRFNAFDEAPPVDNAAAEKREALAAFPWGASRIIALEKDSRRTGTLIITAPNLNVLETSSVIPVLEGMVEPGVTVWIAAVRAGDRDTVTAETPPDARIPGAPIVGVG